MEKIRRRNTTEFARFGRVDKIGAIEALHARFEDHRFAVQVYCLPPDSPHAGKTAGGMCEYVMLYVPDEAWRQQCAAFDVDFNSSTHAGIPG
jgi:hypothetical protein